MDERLDRREFVGYAGAGTGALILGGVPVDLALAGRRRRRRGVSPWRAAAGSLRG